MTAIAGRAIGGIVQRDVQYRVHDSGMFGVDRAVSGGTVPLVRKLGRPAPPRHGTAAQSTGLPSASLCVKARRVEAFGGQRRA